MFSSYKAFINKIQTAMSAFSQKTSSDFNIFRYPIHLGKTKSSSLFKKKSRSKASKIISEESKSSNGNVLLKASTSSDNKFIDRGS